MPSDRFTFICTRTTVDFIVPVSSSSQADFNRRVHNAFQGLVGGVLRVGDLKDRPTEDPLPNHLLCDGSTITRDLFPELVTYLAGSADEATLPDYSGPVTITAPTTTQEVTESGTVANEETAPVPAGDVGGTSGGNILAGTRHAAALDAFLRKAGVA